MKVLHIVTGVNKSSGGTSEIVPRICIVQTQIGIDARLACIRGKELADAATEAIDLGLPVSFYKGTIGWLGKCSYSSDMRVNLWKEVVKADIVHVHGGWAFPVWWGAYCAQKFHKPLVMMPHGSLEPERLKISRWKKTIASVCLDGYAYRVANQVWVTAQSEKFAVEHFGVKKEIKVIPLGLDLSPFDHSMTGREWSAHGENLKQKKRVLFLSRISKIKGLDMLAEAWSLLQEFYDDWELIVAGPDDDHGYRGEAENIFSQHCRQGTYKFIGPVYGNDKYDLLKKSDIFVSPTRNENFGISIQEALATGIPVVCTKGAPWSDIQTYGCGFWTEINAGAIADALHMLMDMNVEQRRRMGLKGVQLIRDKFSWEKIGKEMLTAYQTLV